jgi:hypothetical protein
LRKSVNYGQKRFYNVDTWYETIIDLILSVNIEFTMKLHIVLGLLTYEVAHCVGSLDFGDIFFSENVSGKQHRL